MRIGWHLGEKTGCSRVQEFVQNVLIDMVRQFGVAVLVSMIAVVVCRQKRVGDRGDIDV